MLMNFSLCLPTCLLLLQATTGPAPLRSFHWDWHNSQELSWMQSLRNAKMSNSDKAAIAKAIEEQIRPDMFDLGIKSEDQLVKAALDTRIKIVDLNQDGVPEVVAQAMADCSGDGNCSFWVFKKTSHGYTLLLNGFGQTFTIQKGSANGFRDIVVAAHGSATDSGLTLYRYEDGGYKDVACYEANWAPLGKDGQHQYLKEPRITPAGCN